MHDNIIWLSVYVNCNVMCVIVDYFVKHVSSNGSTLGYEMKFLRIQTEKDEESHKQYVAEWWRKKGITRWFSMESTILIGKDRQWRIENVHALLIFAYWHKKG